MPINGRRKLLRSAKDSNWTSTIPSVYSLSSLGLDTSSLISPADFKIASFYNYVEGQRLPRGLQGSRSLKLMAIEVLIRNLSDLDNLNDIPKHFTKCLWNTLKRRCMLSFHGWKLLSKALHGEEEATLGMFHYSKAIKSPDSPLQVYIKPLISRSFEFITSLSISSACTIVELIQLVEISNLGILEIINSDQFRKARSGVSDIVLRAWSREADKNGAFSVLRILRLWNHEDLTEKSLQYIGTLPALALFDVRDCGISNDEKTVREAEKIGWVVLHNKNLPDALEEKCNEKRKKMSEGSPLEFEQAKRKFTKALWPGSRVHRVTRSDVKSFIAQVGTNSENRNPSTGNQLSISGHISLAINSSFDSDPARWPDYVNEVAEGDEEWVSHSWDIFCNTRDKEPWESGYAACWTRIGEIREDRDLILAGVRGIEQQTFVGPHLVSPVPMAYIRLGDIHQSWGRWEATSTKFVPKSLEEPTSHQGDLTSIRTGVRSRLTSSQSVTDSQLDEASSGKRKVGWLGRVRSPKKQKLDDVLNGFSTGRKQHGSKR